MGRKRKVVYFSGATILGIVVLGVIAFALLTGFMQEKQIDVRDLEYWDYEDGVIVGAKAFEIGGERETCWMLMHGYTGTPNEMRGLAEGLSDEFGDYVYVMRLKGHGKVPSLLLNLTLEDWYEQAESEYRRLESEGCENVNVVGFSFGGALALRLSELEDVQRTYLLAPYIFPDYKPFLIFSTENFVNIFFDDAVYTKKIVLAMINDPVGRESYIAYWNFPLGPVKNSQDFLVEVVRDLGKIESPILIQHSVNDAVADFEGSELVYSRVSSDENDKELVRFERSNHVILADYDRFDAIENIVEFERARR